MNQLARRGWTVRNGVAWHGGGDVDHLVRWPDGLGFAIETKTLTFSQEQVRRTEAIARWAEQRRRRYPYGVIPVLCVVRARRVESRCHDVVVVSLDRLLPVLESLALSTRYVGLSPGRHRSSKRQVQSSGRVLRPGLALPANTVVDDTRREEQRAPTGHRQPERPDDDNPYVKLDGPTLRVFTDAELEPLVSLLQRSLANEIVNRYINEALRALPEHWIRMAGVYLPDLGSPLRYLAVGPSGTFIITPTNGRWTHDGLRELERAGQAVDHLLPAHDFSPTRIRLGFAPNHPTIRPQVLGIPGMRRIWLIKADELYAHLLTHAGAGPCRGDLNQMRRRWWQSCQRTAAGCGPGPPSAAWTPRTWGGRRSTTEASAGMPDHRQFRFARSPGRPLLLARAPLAQHLLGPVGDGELAETVRQLVEHLRDSHAADALERDTKLTDRVVESGPELRRPGSVEVRTKLGRWLQAGGSVGQRAPGQALTIGKAKRTRLLLRRVGELQKTLIVAGGRGCGPVGVERNGPAPLRRGEARERVVLVHRRNPMSIRSRGPIALTVASAGAEGPSGTAGVAASMRSRSERRTRYMRPAFT